MLRLSLCIGRFIGAIGIDDTAGHPRFTVGHDSLSTTIVIDVLFMKGQPSRPNCVRHETGTDLRGVHCYQQHGFRDHGHVGAWELCPKLSGWHDCSRHGGRAGKKRETPAQGVGGVPAQGLPRNRPMPLS